MQKRRKIVRQHNRQIVKNQFTLEEKYHNLLGSLENDWNELATKYDNQLWNFAFLRSTDFRHLLTLNWQLWYFASTVWALVTCVIIGYDTLHQ